MAELQEHPELELVERGPSWLFVRIRPDQQRIDDLADRLWMLLERHFVYRLVLEMDEVELLSSGLIGQLVMLQIRVLQRDGALRLCGLSPACSEVLHHCRLDQALPSFNCREEAVHASSSSLIKPR